MKQTLWIGILLGFISLTGCASNQAMKRQVDTGCAQNEVCHHGHHHHNSRRHHEKAPY